MLTIDTSQALAGLGEIVARLAATAPFLQEVGEWQKQKIQQRIIAQKRSPFGEPWAPWSERRLHEREAKGNTHLGLLWDTGHLLGSFEVQADEHQVTIGTPVEYAQELQEGRSTPTPMPARPFVGWGEDDGAMVEIMFARWLSGSMAP